jgi:hypothetical protein
MDHTWNKVEGKVFPLYALRAHVLVEATCVSGGRLYNSALS